jgi:hypothetical protein
MAGAQLSRCGFGAIDVGPLAQAQFSGELSPSFLPTQYFQPAYMQAGQQSPVGTPYATDSFAAAIASLLGGQVVQAPPPGNLNGTDIPDGDWISVDGEMIWAGNLFPPGIVLSFPDECAAENYLVQSIPGASLSAVCAAGGTGETPYQLALAKSAPAPAAAVSTLGPGASFIGGGIKTPIGGGATLPITGGGGTSSGGNTTRATQPPPPSQVLSGTAGSNAGGSNAGDTSGSNAGGSNAGDTSGSNAGGSNGGNTSSDTSATCSFNPLSAALGITTCIGPMGIVEWAIVAGGAIWAFSKGGR